jgi:hypoxanthine phosphoribosyltransferase
VFNIVKISFMKTLKITLILLIFSIVCDAQSLPIKTKTFFWGNSEKVFYDELTDSGKTLLDSCLKIVQFDSSNCVRLTSDEQIKYTSKDYLSKHNYEYMTIYKYENVINMRKYSNGLVSSNNAVKKVLLRYSKDDRNEIDRITIHVID